MTTKKAAKKKATKRKPQTVLIGRGLPDPCKTGKRFFCVVPVYAQQMTQRFQLIGTGEPIRKKGDFLMKRGDRMWSETREEFMQTHTMVDENAKPYASFAPDTITDCDDMFRWYRSEEGRWVKAEGLSAIDWLIGLAAIVAILFAGTALMRSLPDAYIWWRTFAG